MAPSHSITREALIPNLSATEKSEPGPKKKMPKRRSPIFERALKLLNTTIFMAKMRKPICPNLICLKKTRILKKLKHSNYAFIQEYQFSPSSTPLFHYYRKPFKKRSRGRDIYSMFFLCSCSGSLRGEGECEGDEESDYALDAPAIIDDGSVRELPELLDSGDGDDSVDQRAELFIRRFYEEMRMQRE